MSERLDQMIARLAAVPPDLPLDGFEAEVGRGVGRWRADARIASALGPVRLASIGLALVIGVTVGDATATGSMAAARSAGLLSSAADLAPSTLLEGAR